MSLMQLAKVSSALARLDDSRVPFISVLTDPTTGGVSASYAMLGDLNIAEPGAMIGFAGPRVIEQTIRQKLPEGFQTRGVPAGARFSRRDRASQGIEALHRAGVRFLPRFPMTYDESVRALLALGRELASPQQAHVQKFGLRNIAELSEALGNPHLRIPCVHIAGTNGKGSTAAMLDSIIRAAGIRCGLYTSPHLERINERIRIDGADISDEAFAAAWTRVHAAIEGLLASGKLSAHPTYFECITALAFVAFVESGVGFAVYEVGLGGRLDSTNLVQPEVAIITSIDFDHESFLGHSIREIAGEKAGIIKAGALVVSSVERAEARAVIAQRCEEMRARLVEIDEAWRIDSIEDSDGFYRASVTAKESQEHFSIAPPLAGRFQVRNALAAATAARLLAARGFCYYERSHRTRNQDGSMAWTPRAPERTSGSVSGRYAQSCRS